MELSLDEADVERIVVPLAGSFTVTHLATGSPTTTVLAGRPSVFAGPTDVLYLPCGTTGTITGTGRVAVATSPTTKARPARHVAAAEIPVELRGAGAASRQVHNFGTPDALDAGRLIVCEVITPAGNWSSYPAHKHDEHVPGHESRLEEIYYFEAAPEVDAMRKSIRAAPSGCSAPTPRPRARSTSMRWCAPVTSRWSRTAITARRSRRRATTSTT